MTRSRDTGGPGREASGATSPVSGQDRPAKAPGLALPADLGRSLRLLNDEQLDRLAKAAFEEARRRGRDVPDNTVGDKWAVGKARSGEIATGETGPGRQGRLRDAGTGAPDPRRRRGRPQTGGHRAGIPPLVGDRAKVLSPVRTATAARRSDRWLSAIGGQICPRI